MSSLIEKHNTWEAVVEHMAMKVEKFGIIAGDFKEWMLKQKNYSPSGYKNGVFLDIEGYVHAYSIYKKINSDNNQQHVLLVCGKVGKGKSTLGLQICALADPSFNMERVYYIPPQFFGRLAKCQKGEANQIDEGGRFFKGRRAMTKLGKDVSDSMQEVRELNQLFVICYDEPEKMDKDVLQKVDSMIIKLENPSENGDRRYRSYLGFNTTNFRTRVLPLLLKDKKPVLSPEVLRLSSWKGHNTVEIPTLNDVDEQEYRSNKTRYLRLGLKEREERYMKQFKAMTEEDKDKEKYITTGQAARKLGCHPVTIIKKCDNGEIRCHKVGKKRYVYDTDIENIKKNSPKADTSLIFSSQGEPK